MTTIAVTRDEMACDLQGTIGDSQKLKMNTKIYKYNPHPLTYNKCRFMIGFAGSVDDIITMSDFFYSPDAYEGVQIKLSQGIQGVVLTERGDMFYMTSPEKWMLLKDDVFAIGTGANVALGALNVGATPREAVKAAIKVDPYSGMGVKSYSFK